MKIAAVKKFTQVLVAMAVAAVMAALLCAPKALGTTIGDFSIEQIYVNVPELDVFVQATDAQGQPISPDLVRAAGVELYLGDEKIPTGNIGMANEPICYVLAVDNSVDETTLKEYRIALRQLISAKGAKDQIMLYTLAGDAACVLPATIDTRAAVNAVNALESQEENEPNLVQAATIIYNDINENYQSIAPRKVIFALTEAGNTATGTALLGAVAKDAASRLNMPLDIFVTVDDDNPLAELGQALGGDKLDVVHESELADTLAEKQQALANALEIKTAVDENFYGERLDVLTLSVPQLGSAVKTNATVYMGHRLAKPAVESVTLHGRYAMTIRFNQAVGRAEDLTCYSIQSEDIWGWHVKVKQALASADGRSVSLYTEPLYQGTYTIKLNKMTSAMTAANVSDSGTVYRFTVDSRGRQDDPVGGGGFHHGCHAAVGILAAQVAPVGKGCKIHPIKVVFQLHDIFLVFSKINVRLHNKYNAVLEVPSICRFIFSVWYKERGKALVNLTRKKPLHREEQRLN